MAQDIHMNTSALTDSLSSAMADSGVVQRMIALVTGVAVAALLVAASVPARPTVTVRESQGANAPRVIKTFAFTSPKSVATNAVFGRL